MEDILDIFNKELSLEDLIKFDWYSIDYSKVSESDYIFLKNRGKYLTEYIDKLDNLANYKEIEELPKGDSYIIPWGPSKGKTSAIRRFIVENRLKYGVFATKKISDIDMLYIDIIAQAKYLNYQTISVAKYHSRVDNPQISYQALEDKLNSKFWILCTHERLFIDPQTLIYAMRNTPFSTTVRNYLLIDEYPSTLYKFINSESAYNLLTMELFSELGDSNVENSPESSSIRYSLIRNLINECYENPTSVDKPMIGVVKSIPTPTNQSFKLDIQRGIHSDESIRSKDRISFFAYYFYEKLKEEIQKSGEEQNSRIYYSIFNLPPTTKYIFDGTGDILFKDSSKFELTNNNYPRSLKVKKLTRIESKITRKSKLEDIITEYSTMINNICKDNPDSNILLYTWKSSKDESYVYRCDEEDIEYDNDIPKLLYDSINIEDKHRVNIIHYQSGKERVTSEYKNSDVLVILGEFYIPTSVIADIKYITETRSLSTADYTESLIVQCIYRTQARIRNPIKLYYSGYSSDFIYKCLLDCNLESEVEETTEDLGCSELDRRLSIEMMDLELYDRLVKLSNNGKISTTRISEFFGYKRFDSQKINNKLEKGNIPFEYYPSKQVDKNVWSDGYYLISLEFYSN